MMFAEDGEVAEDRFVIETGAAVNRDDRIGAVADDAIVQSRRIGPRAVD
jgi:hypothetical protein